VSTPVGTIPSTVTPLPGLTAGASSKDSLTAQLVDRLNPFRASGGTP
jgi:hypothetical protein